MAGDEENFQQVMNQGHSAAWDQNWGQAAAYYRQALATTPDQPQALTSLGLALFELQEYEEALLCYQKAAKVLPEDPLPLEKIAQLCERMGNLDLATQASLRAAESYLKHKDAQKAIENWDRVTQLDPENLQAHSRLALVYEKMGNKARAVSEYLASASALQRGGNPVKARQAIEQALKIMPGNKEARQFLDLLMDYKQLPKPGRRHSGTAPQRMLRARQLQSASPEAQADSDPISQACQKALTTLAGMLFEAEEGGETAQRKGLQAIVTGMSGVSVKPKDRTRLMLHVSQVVDLQTRREYAQAAEELQRGMDLGLEHPAAYFDLGYLYGQVGRLENAVRQLQIAVKSYDFALGARLLLGDLMRKKGLLKEAAVEYLQALKLADVQITTRGRAEELAQLYELLIEAQRQQDNPELEEMLCWNIHNMLVRSDWQVQLKRVRQQMTGGKEKGPLLPLAGVLTEARSSQVIDSASKIYDLIERGLLDSAMEEAYYAVQLAPTYLPMHSLMGDMLVKQGNIERAAGKYRVISRTYTARGEMDQAIQFSRKVIQLLPTDLGAQSRLIDQLLIAGRVGEAIDEYTHLAEAYYNLADLNMARKTYMEAFKAAQQANFDRTSRVMLLHRAADIDLQSLDWRQALRILEQIRTLQPDDEEARSQIIGLSLRLGLEQQALAELDNFASYLATNNRHEELTAFISGLLEDQPERIPVRRRLVDALIHAGQVEEAVNQLDLIGETLLQAEDRAGAIQTIEAIINLSPPNKAEYMLLLSQLRREMG